MTLIVILMLGVTSVQNWEVATAQRIYGLILCTLLAGCHFNTVSVDQKARAQKVS